MVLPNNWEESGMILPRVGKNQNSCFLPVGRIKNGSSWEFFSRVVSPAPPLQPTTRRKEGMVRCSVCRTFVRQSGMTEHHNLFHPEPEPELPDVQEEAPVPTTDTELEAIRQFEEENAEFERRINSDQTSSPVPRRRNAKRRLEAAFIDDDSAERMASLSKKAKGTNNCTVCHKSFARKDTLKRHISTIHK